MPRPVTASLKLRPPLPNKCEYCPRRFAEERGVSNHLRYCHEATRQRKDEDEGLSRAMKRARRSSPSPEPDLNVNEDWNTSPLTDTALEVEAPPAPESPPASFSLSGRRRRVPRVLKDYIPHSLVGLLHLRPTPCEPTLDEEPEVPSPASTPAPDPEPDTDYDPEFTTEPNGFGLYRQYTRKPLTDPEDSLVLEDLVDDSDDSPE